MSKLVNPNLKNFGLLPISFAAAACADADARFPLPVDDDQARLYRAIFDELGASGTVALRLKSGFIDIESGKAPSYNKLKDQKQFIGMTPTAGGETEWDYQAKHEKVYAVCERMSCQPVQRSGDNKYSDNF